MLLSCAPLFGRVQVAKHGTVETCGGEVCFCDHVNFNACKQTVNLIEPRLQSFFSQRSEGAAINGAQGLKPSAGARHCDQRGCGTGLVDQIREKSRSHEGHIHCQDEVEFALALTQSSMNPPEGSAAGVPILDDGSVRAELGG